MSMTEQWRPAPGFPGYEVSSDGRVRSWKRSRVRVLKDRPDRSGHMHVALHRSDGRHDVSVHRLVAGAFHGPCPAGLEVRHLDGRHANNHADNLVYGTHRQNMIDIADHGKHHQALKTHCPAGHPYDAANTLHPPSSPRSRRCRTCRNARNRAYYHRVAQTGA